mmetsp:Transcript_8024/g.12734  ORF Transcript_8024/g.12734 Transcript_8024/m.12734 type:complete len:212 (+) Transcript_8024:299-934(+)|eukprot:CAMPEP_0184315528 /NCGR_PEP_ID=MMETSP1049-20130417/83091_1 /TAXON_ID=77928 /ORGANISM="Proteomonas sulcata, Strain CCMP704" /LENGTH=211 /DNA_ID=CAMNT_0026634057 /DNA_START=210 /DNA_END=845 /DNA_ORIENTATION=+
MSIEEEAVKVEAPQEEEQDDKAAATKTVDGAEAEKLQKQKAKEEEQRKRREDAEKKAAEDEARRKQEEAKRQAELEELRTEVQGSMEIPATAVQQMSEGLIGASEPTMEQLTKKLLALQAAQANIIELLAKEDRKVMTLPHMAEVAQALAHVPVYTKRLQEMRKDMDSLTNRVKGMRKRAAKLYTKKQQEDNTAAQKRQQLLEQEKERLQA